MTDIVKRLRDHHRATGDWAQSDASIYTQAADEIERLRRDNTEMRELLNTLAEGRGAALEPKRLSAANNRYTQALAARDTEVERLREENECLRRQCPYCFRPRAALEPKP